MRIAICLVALLATLSQLFAAENMIGRQSQNEGISAVPVPGKVTIDGQLDDWDWSGRIWVFADTAVRDRYSVEAAAMWDADYLYLAAKWADPTPMFSTVDPNVTPNEGWKCDAWQMRVSTADQTSWLTTWYYTPKRQPVMHVAVWNDPTNSRRGGTTERLLVAEPGGTALGEGVEMAYRELEGGKGFIQEIRIPWGIVYKEKPAVEPGLTLKLGCEFLWGDPTGQTSVHRYADNMQPGQTSREFYWTALKAWGDVKLVAENRIPVRQYRSDEARLEGTVPVRVTIPADAARFTVVVEDAQGKRIRSLAADCSPSDYRVGEVTDGQQTVEVLWDCLDDVGKLIEPGTYRLRGLTHAGLSADYEMCFYNPGTPPWQTRDGSGAWGADHSPPNSVAAAGGWTFVTWAVPEGGSGIIGIDPEGRKRWGNRRGITALCADSQYVYTYVEHWYVKGAICRFDLTTGDTKPFVLDGAERVFDLPLSEILGEEKPGHVKAMAVHGDRLVLGLEAGKLVILDPATGVVKGSHAIAGIAGLAFAADGALYGLVDGKAQKIDLASGALTPIATPGLEQPSALAIDGDGNLLFTDLGKDKQVKAYSLAGKLVYTCGQPGGRPIRGAFQPQAMLAMTSVAVDARGDVWVVEGWNYPRRVSVWNRDGSLKRDYLGNTGYAGSSCYLHDSDPTLGYDGPLEFKLDKATRSWTLQSILWVPDRDKGETFDVGTQSHVNAQRFTSAVSGQPREYWYAHEARSEGTGHVVFMERNGGWQPVAALATVGHLGECFGRGFQVLKQPEGELAGLNPFDGAIWNDDNRDGIVQRAELTIVPAKVGARNRPQPGFAIGDGWGGRMGMDLSIYTNGLTRWKPARYTDDGAPVYTLEAREDLGIEENGDLVPVPNEDKLICLSWKGYAGPTRLAMIDLAAKDVLWQYPNPYPGVHGSHRATMPRPGLLIGPLKTCGVAHIDDQIGNVFLLRGNLGQDFLMTTDGLYVGAMFQDGRLPGEALPATEAQLVGFPMDTFSEGGEPFNGWFGKQADGVVRLTTGMPRQAAMILQIKGLESIRRYTGGELAVTMPMIVQASTDNAIREQAKTEAPKATIAKAPGAMTIDGQAGDWKGIKPLTIKRDGQPQQARVWLAWDAANLYALFEVTDPSPWRNEGKDIARLFKTGDAVDLQLGPKHEKPSREPRAGDLRVVVAPVGKQPLAVLMRPVAPGAAKELAKAYTSPVGTKNFDLVQPLAEAQSAVQVAGDKYTVEIAVPWSALGFVPAAGLALSGDLGLIGSDAPGLINVSRTYWANQQTNLVNDEPIEAWFTPAAWGELILE